MFELLIIDSLRKHGIFMNKPIDIFSMRLLTKYGLGKSILNGLYSWKLCLIYIKNITFFITRYHMFIRFFDFTKFFSWFVLTFPTTMVVYYALFILCTAFTIWNEITCIIQYIILQARYLPYIVFIELVLFAIYCILCFPL